MYDLRGRSALVTGAASGIGKQLVLDLARKGCVVTVIESLRFLFDSKAL